MPTVNNLQPIQFKVKLSVGRDHNMKPTASKSFKQPSMQATGNKRAVSPLPSQPILQSSSNTKSVKKKAIGSSPYQKAIKQFESYGKAERKKISNYLETEGAEQNNKFRIVTEPVDDRIMHLAQNNIFNSSLAGRKKAEGEQSGATHIKLNLRESSKQIHSKSRERIFSTASGNQRHEDQHYDSKSAEKSEKNRSRSREPIGATAKCRHCARYVQLLEHISAQMKKIAEGKQLWRAGEITLSEMKELINTPSQQRTSNSKSSIRYDSYTHNSLHNLRQASKVGSVGSIDQLAGTIMEQVRATITDLVSEIEVLVAIDYPKMLQMQVFQYEPSYSDYVDVQENELRDLFAQLRSTVEGKTIDYDTYDSDTENTYTTMMLRNMKSRLSGCLRENLELRICKAIYEKSQEISEESEEYLRKVIEDVLEDYTHRGPERRKTK